MERARRHQRLLSALAFGLLAVTAELVGASLTHRIDLGRHVRSPSYSHAAYYPAVIAAVKVGIALLLAALVLRMLRAHAIERAARRVAGAVGGELPRVRITVSARLCVAFFTVTAGTYLVHTDAARIASGRWALFFPLVHSSALPVFAQRGPAVVPGGEEVCVQISTDLSRSAVRSSWRARFVLWLGPVCALGGVVWALLQPYRITLLHPYGQGFWWLISEPPLYVVLVGLAFYWFVAPGVIEDLEDAERERRH